MALNAFITEFILSLFNAILTAIFGAESFLGGGGFASFLTALLTRGG